MRLALTLLTLAVLSMSCGPGPTGASGTWKKAGDLPAGAQAKCILVDGDAILVGHSQGISKSTDDGATWMDLNNGLVTDAGVTMQVEFLAYSQNVLLAGGEETFGTTDRGGLWRRSDMGLPNNVSVYTLFTSGTTTVAGMNASSGLMGGVFRTTNKGMSWLSSATGIPNTTGANSFEKVGSTLYASVSMAIARSTDEGVTWTMSPGAPGMSNGLWLENLEGTLYVATASAGVQSTGDGVVFTPINNGLPTGKIISTVFANGTNLYAGTDGAGNFVTTDRGVQWLSLNDGFTGLPRTIQFAVRGTKLFAVTETAGVWTLELK
jgi:hypothetical protein